MATRQKKELSKKIEQMMIAIQVDKELGCGMSPAGAYDSIYKAMAELEEELARLSHYENAMQRMMDTRGLQKEDIPFS